MLADLISCIPSYCWGHANRCERRGREDPKSRNQDVVGYLEYNTRVTKDYISIILHAYMDNGA